MPNLKQVYELKEKFYELEFKDKNILEYLKQNEAKEVLLKAFNNGGLNEDINEKVKFFSFLTENLNPQKPELIKYFDEGKNEDVVLLFIDITSFSKTIINWSNTQIKDYLDDYYKRIIPIIYKYGGEIEKLMGDGIICVFGKPFLEVESPENVYQAERCAEDVIKEFHNSNKNVKVAIHKGEITYYKVPGEDYGEYTMIGQPITELYRLESVSVPNAINFFSESSYDGLGWEKCIWDVTDIIFGQQNINKLQGVDFMSIKNIKIPDYL
ncbi:adenylate/guanylate cyclase domain-containing protein [Empedobacter sp.]|uniref:adenylate/guanylate cyclase domain-containing protein n=1 Tax=Empedobacter sp. TaxID=1927715 RepID=UPI0028AEC4D2|nr:adenylate/guanylate cyclase domain-containing protein [Empedobacter sp.]